MINISFNALGKIDFKFYQVPKINSLEPCDLKCLDELTTLINNKIDSTENEEQEQFVNDVPSFDLIINGENFWSSSTSSLWLKINPYKVTINDKEIVVIIEEFFSVPIVFQGIYSFYLFIRFIISILHFYL